MRGLALIAAVLVPVVAMALEPPNPEVFWNSTRDEHASTSRWVCSSVGDDVIEFRYYPALLLLNVGSYTWIIRHGQTYMYAGRVQKGLENYFLLQDSSHEIHIGADRVARYYTFSALEGDEQLQPSAIWQNCKETR